MKRAKAKTLRIGTVSAGTMRPEDLIPALLDAAEGLRLSKADRARVKTIRQSFERCGDNGDDYNDSVGAQEDVDELFNILGEHCPPFCYFGAHEGDGADAKRQIDELLA